MKKVEYPEIKGYNPQMKKFQFGSIRKAAVSLILLLATPVICSGTGVYISEFVAVNSSTLTNKFGAAEDWIEIYNSTAQSVNLTGWYLTDSPASLTKWAFPAVTLPAKGYLIVWASGRDTVYNGEIHTSFKLDGDGEYLALVRPNGTTVEHDYFPVYPEQKKDVSYGVFFTGIGDEITLSSSHTNCQYLVPTANIGTNWRSRVFNASAWSNGSLGIGYAKAGNDFLEYIETNVQTLMSNKMASIYIRIPFTVDDPAGLKHVEVKMRYEDGFAAYLNGTAIASDNLPSGQTATTLVWNAGAYLGRDEDEAVVMSQIFSNSTPVNFLVAGTNVLAIHGLNYKTTSSDLLMQAEILGTRVDQLVMVGNRYFAAPTPGSVNSGDALGLVADTKFSVDRGFYEAPFDLIISTATAGAVIRYTLDGSTPTDVSGTVYTGPIHITNTAIVRARATLPGWLASTPDTHTYLFLENVIRQPAKPAGFPAGYNEDYEMDPEVVNSPDYSADFPAVLLRIPTLSLVTDYSNLFGSSSGLLYKTNGVANAANEGVAWERPVSAEWIYPDGTEGFQVNCGLRAQGAYSRSNSPKNSLRLLFKNVYGPSKLRFNLFPDSEVDQFDTIVLRGGYNTTWHYLLDHDRRTKAQYAREAFARELQLAMGHPSPHGRFVHLYINGLYWGLYNTHERPAETFASDYFGGSKEDWDVYNVPEVVAGNGIAWTNMFNIATNIGLSTLASYTNFLRYCDVVSLADYMIINHYIGNDDWDNRNVYAARRRRAGEGYKFFCWDAERSIYHPDTNRTPININLRPSKLFHQARTNAEFRLLVADRLHRHLFNNGPLTTNGAVAIWRKISDVVDGVAVAESARWGDASGTLYTVNDNYLPEQNRIMTEYFPVRSGIFFNQYKSLGLYPTLDAPEFAVHGGTFTGSTNISLSGPSAIYYTLDGSDPREFGTGNIRGTALSGPVPITHTTRVKARCWNGSMWSALTEADFYDLSPSPLRVTEIMHSPRAPDAGESAVNADPSAYRFIELYNGGSEPIGLAGIKFTDGIRFDFSTGSLMTLAPGGYALLVRDRYAFLARYPGLESQIAGEYLGDLSGSGEKIKIDGYGIGTVFSFSYSNARDWPLQADGAGHSLVPLNAETVSCNLLSYGRNWRASRNVDGSPGTADQDTVPALCLNEITAHTDLSNPAYPDYDSNDWIELYNAGTTSVSLGDYYLSDDPYNLLKWHIPAGTLNPQAFITFDEITGFHSPITNGFGIDKAGEQILLSYAPSGTPVRVVDAFRFKGQ
ncbi:MAG: lamin tail domain-containing protein, partial [Pontiellaceae bacterium]|nr:lamin tail domain-containing protein [Pontiellaceae bacterium]